LSYGRLSGHCNVSERCYKPRRRCDPSTPARRNRIHE